MAAQDNMKFFWLKLFTRFFDKHEIQILWGKNRDFVLLYLRLLLESVPNHGVLKYNSELSYSTEDIALLFHMPENVVAAGLKELVKRQLITLDKDGTITVPAAPKMCGFDTGASIRMRDKRNSDGNDSEPNAPATSQDDNGPSTVVPSIQNQVPCDSDTVTDPPSIPSIQSNAADAQNTTSVIFKGSDQFDHVSKETVSRYFIRMRNHGGKNSSVEIENDFWQYLISVDFKKGDGMPINSANMHTTFSKWITNRNKEERKLQEEEATSRKADEEERDRLHNAEMMMANTLASEADL